MLLVCGATGELGARIAERLAQLGIPLRALVRPGSDASRLEALGFEIARGDLRDPASLRDAAAGVDTVVTTANAISRAMTGGSDLTIHDVDDVGNANLVVAAEAAGVRRFVFVSLPAQQLEARTPFTDAKRATEARLAAAPFETVFVRPDAFQEVWFSPTVGFDPAHGSVRVFGSGTGRIRYVALDDVAEAVAQVAVAEGPPGELLLGGPEAISPLEAAAAYTRISGRPMKVSHVPRAVMVIGSLALRRVRPVIASLMGMSLAVDGVDTELDESAFLALGITPRPASAFLGELATRMAG